MISLNSISNKVQAGQRINEDEALFLFQHPDLMAVGALADQANIKKNKNLAFYNVNRHINPTNICALSCKFCAYSRKPGEEGGYEYSTEEILEKVQQAVDQDATEVHMVGGLHPRWRLSHYTDFLSAIKSKFPTLHIKAFTAVELDWLARRARVSIEEIITTLKEAGLDSLPGGGAEIFHQDVRDEITAKLSAEEWIDIHRTAHRLGLQSNCTMLYGHVEKYHHRVDHMRYLRDLQDETEGFNAFIPLSFQPHNNEMGISRYTFGADDLKTLAVARLYLDNFQHIKAYWIMLGQDIAQLGLNFGANDLDGTVTEEKISNMAGSQGGIAMSRKQIEDLILATSHDACERDTLYQNLGQVRRATEPNYEGLNEHKLTAAMDLVGTDYHSLIAEANHLCQTATQQSKFKTFATGIKHLLMPKQPLQEVVNELKVKVAVAEKSELLFKTEEIRIDLSHFQKKGSVVGEPEQETTIEYTVSDLAELISTLVKNLPSATLILQGIRGFWQIAQASRAVPQEAFAILKESGLSSFESSELESETALTITEVTGIHRAAHQIGLKTLAKVEVSSSIKDNQILWKPFLTRLVAFNELAGESENLLALSIEPDAQSRMSAMDFQKAVAISRLLTPAVKNISAPVLKAPSLLGKAGFHHSIQATAQKTACLNLLCGANDFGYIDTSKQEHKKIVEEIISIGFKPTLRDKYFQPITSYLNEKTLDQTLEQTAHRPNIR